MPTLPRRRRVLAALVLAAASAAFFAACGNDTPTRPSASGKPGSVEVSLSWGGDIIMPFTVGRTKLATADIHYADGTGRDCTDLATWRSSDPAVLGFPSAGRVTALRAGTTVLTATCLGMTGSLEVTVYAATTITGTVRSQAGEPLADAGIIIWDNKYATTGRTDGIGRYRIPSIARGATYQVEVGKAGYESLSMDLVFSGEEMQQDFTLVPGIQVSGIVKEAATGAPVEEATVEVVSGPSAGLKAVTYSGDRSSFLAGKYSLQHVQPGRFTLRASKTGYQAAEQTVDAPANTVVDFTLKSAAGACLVSVNPLLIEHFPSAGGVTTLDVNANPGIRWTAAADQPWMEVTSSGSGSARLSLRILPSPLGAPALREGIVQVACGAEGRKIRVSQLPDCQTSLAWAPDSPTLFPAAGGAGHLLIKTGVAGCFWAAANVTDWIHSVGVSQGSGDSDMPHFMVAPNTSGVARTGVIVFGEKSWEVRQAGQ